jgi:cytochrome P450
MTFLSSLLGRQAVTPKAYFHEVSLYLFSRPLQFAVGHSSQYFGRASYLPFNNTYFVNDPAIAKTILTDTDHFSLNAGGGLGFLIGEVMGHDQPALFNMEGLEHLKMKTLLVQIFQPQYLAKIVGESLDPELSLAKKRLQDEGSLDVALLAKRCTSRLSCHMIGITNTDRDFEYLLQQVTELSDQLTSMLSITTRYPTTAQKTRGQNIYKQLCDLIEHYYTSKNIPAHSVIAQMKSQGLSFDQAKSLLITLIIAGTETVASALPRICAILIDDQKWQQCARQQALLPMVVSEGLRITSPAPVIVHGVKKDTIVDGYHFKANKRILIMLINILRNNRFFPDAMSMNLQRVYDQKYRTFWFGAGPHYCLGAQLAQLELSYVLKKLFALGDTATIIKRQYARGTSFPGYQTLRLTFE